MNQTRTLEISTGFEQTNPNDLVPGDGNGRFHNRTGLEDPSCHFQARAFHVQYELKEV